MLISQKYKLLRTFKLQKKIKQFKQLSKNKYPKQCKFKEKFQLKLLDKFQQKCLEIESFKKQLKFMR